MNTAEETSEEYNPLVTPGNHLAKVTEFKTRAFNLFYQQDNISPEEALKKLSNLLSEASKFFNEVGDEAGENDDTDGLATLGGEAMEWIRDLSNALNEYLEVDLTGEDKSGENPFAALVHSREKAREFRNQASELFDQQNNISPEEALKKLSNLLSEASKFFNEVGDAAGELRFTDDLAYLGGEAMEWIRDLSNALNEHLEVDLTGDATDINTPQE